MVACNSCGDVIVPEFDKFWGKFKEPWEDKEGRPYCDQCFYELYTVPEEKAIDNYNHDNKKVRERARAKLKELEAFWGSC